MNRPVNIEGSQQERAALTSSWGWGDDDHTDAIDAIITRIRTDACIVMLDEIEKKSFLSGYHIINAGKDEAKFYFAPFDSDYHIIFDMRSALLSSLVNDDKAGRAAFSAYLRQVADEIDAGG